MRNLIDIMDYRPSLVATIGAAVAQTVVGNPIDTLGFHDCMVLVTYACIGGTAANESNLTIRFQEADISTVVGSFADITDGEIMGSMKVQTANGMATTYPVLAATTFYEKFGGVRKRYIRPIVLGSNQGCEYAVTVGCMLSRPVDTLYIAKQSILTSTYNAEYLKPVV